MAGTNLLAALAGAFTLVSYLFLYTPLKQRTWLSTTMWARFPGAMPPIIGYAAAAGGLSAQAWALFAILFLWQFPHFYAIAWMYREDYARAGIRMLPVVEPDGQSTARQMVLYGLALIPVSLLPWALGMSGRIYHGGGAGGSACGSCTRACAWLLSAPAVRARSVLLVSVLYLPLIYGLMLVDTSRTVISVENITHRYGSRTALVRTSAFEVAGGEIFGLLGPNGGGKSTLFRILSTMMTPAEGTAMVAGFDVKRQPAEVRRRIGVVFQTQSLDKALTVAENLRGQGHLHGLSGAALGERMERSMSRLGLVDRRNDLVGTLSGGLRRRVEIAKGLLHAPQVLLMDEASTGLDPGARARTVAVRPGTARPRGRYHITDDPYPRRSRPLRPAGAAARGPARGGGHAGGIAVPYRGRRGAARSR